MSDTPKFEVIDRRKLKAQEEHEAVPAAEREKPPAAQPPKPQESAGPRLVTETPARTAASAPPAASPAHEPEMELPPAPSAQESKEQKAAYDASAQRIEEMARAQNPGMGAQPPVTFEQLIQQFYLSGLIQMGVGAQQGERAQIDILGARSTIDLLGILAEKTRGNLTAAEDRMLQSVLYELRMMFLEITGMISMPGVPPPKKRQ
jgi:hypothetical protein